MTSKIRLLASMTVFSLALSQWGCGAAAEQNRTMVPEENQEESEEMYGQQAQSMGTLNQTQAEQSTDAHYSGVRPVENPHRKPKD